jgi:hypothetical protein
MLVFVLVGVFFVVVGVVVVLGVLVVGGGVGCCALLWVC